MSNLCKGVLFQCSNLRFSGFFMTINKFLSHVTCTVKASTLKLLFQGLVGVMALSGGYGGELMHLTKLN